MMILQSAGLNACLQMSRGTSTKTFRSQLHFILCITDNNTIIKIPKISQLDAYCLYCLDSEQQDISNYETITWQLLMIANV